ncbi:MAG: GNAT family N-acetyltransferase [Defluviitaleaceae bacterium]|nr:GNAT family N-acetyltransferase [Defluviitaleaceae bacterium]MCL2835815.1 GNAT family N-acetyltransferase [Defluviitaleaceae bacterium]
MIIQRPYRCLVDFEKVYRFMIKNYEIDWRNGKPATAFEYSQLLYWTDHTQDHRNTIWEDDGCIVGFCWYDSKIGEAYFNLTPGYEVIITKMIEYSHERLSKEDGSLHLCVYSSQKSIIDEIKRQGYELICEHKEGIYDFSKNTLNYKLPEGYHFKPLADCDRLELQNATWRGFDQQGDSEGGIETVRRFDTAPNRTPELDVVIVDDKGDYACYAMMWYIPENKLAYLEPFCTEPKHRRKGLAAAALSELVRRTKLLGATHMTGGSNEFYFRVGYDPVTIFTKWSRITLAV